VQSEVAGWSVFVQANRHKRQYAAFEFPQTPQPRKLNFGSYNQWESLPQPCLPVST
jgi:hypothetical protein